MNSRKVGAGGEETAAQYLLLRGYEIIMRNYGIHIGEIDLIAYSPDGILVFVEVKLVNALCYGDPAWKITAKKRSIIARVAEFYLREHELHSIPYRIDAITITPEKTAHYKNCL